MKEKEIEIDGKKIRVITRVQKESIEENNLKIDLDDTIELENIIKEVKNDTKA